MGEHKTNCFLIFDSLKRGEVQGHITLVQFYTTVIDVCGGSGVVRGGGYFVVVFTD